MVQLTMLQTRIDSEDGHTVKRFVKGKQYDVAESTARHFFRLGWAEKAVMTYENLADTTFSKLEPLPVFNAVENTGASND